MNIRFKEEHSFVCDMSLDSYGSVLRICGKNNQNWKILFLPLWRRRDFLLWKAVWQHRRGDIGSGMPLVRCECQTEKLPGHCLG